MQVQYQVEQKNNSMLDNNNDRNAKPEWGTERKEKGSIDRFAFITERTCKGLQRNQAFFEEPLVLVSLKKSKKDFTVESEIKYEQIDYVWLAQGPYLSRSYDEPCTVSCLNHLMSESP